MAARSEVALGPAPAVARRHAEQVAAVLQPQVDGMRSVGYSRSEILGFDVAVLNSTAALYRGTFSRQRSDGGGQKASNLTLGQKLTLIAPARAGAG